MLVQNAIVPFDFASIPIDGVGKLFRGGMLEMHCLAREGAETRGDNSISEAYMEPTATSGLYSPPFLTVTSKQFRATRSNGLRGIHRELMESAIISVFSSKPSSTASADGDASSPIR